MTPGGAEPLDRTAIARIAGDPPEIVENIVEPHLAQAVKQRARVIEHHPRLVAFIQKLRNEFAHALLTPTEHRRVVIVADTRIIHHVFKVADDGAVRRSAPPAGISV